jgi:hypothetical protein
MPDLRASVSRSALRPARPKRRNPVWPVAGGVALAVLALAAIDGGERALRPISEEVRLPAAAAGSAPR